MSGLAACLALASAPAALAQSRATAAALATGMIARAHETDVGALGRYMLTLDAWRDSTLMAAATRLADDPAATTAARVFGVRYLLQLEHPFLRFPFDGLVRGETTGVDSTGMEITTIGCSAVAIADASRLVGTPLPADYASRIRASLAALAASSGTPDSVKNAARCGP